MVKIKIQPDFAKDDALKTVFIGSQAERDAVLRSWCKIAKLVLVTGKFPTKLGTKIQNVSSVVEIDDVVFGTFGYQRLESCGLIERTERKASTVGLDKFEEFWKAYPQRLTESGLKTKGSRREALNTFSQEIRNALDFENLMNALGNYKRICSNKPKDAVRFIRNKFYKDYLTIDATATDIAKTTKQLLSPDKLNEMLNGN